MIRRKYIALNLEHDYAEEADAHAAIGIVTPFDFPGLLLRLDGPDPSSDGDADLDHLANSLRAALLYLAGDIDCGGKGKLTKAEQRAAREPFYEAGCRVVKLLAQVDPGAFEKNPRLKRLLAHVESLKQK